MRGIISGTLHNVSKHQVQYQTLKYILGCILFIIRSKIWKKSNKSSVTSDLICAVSQLNFSTYYLTAKTFGKTYFRRSRTLQGTLTLYLPFLYLKSVLILEPMLIKSILLFISQIKEMFNGLRPV